MKKSMFANATLASVLSLVLAASAAHAADALSNDRNQAQSERPGVATGVVASDSEAMRDAKTAAIKADRNLRANADEFRAFLQGNDPKAPLEPVVIRRDMTAEAMLDADVVDANGKKVAEVEDILINSKGRPDKIVVADGGMMGIGAKKAAFDFGTVKTTNTDGKQVVSVSEDMLKKAPEFSYDADDAGKENTMVKAASTASVKKILDGHIVDAKGDKVADIENVAFNGTDTQLIVKFNDTFGMGGDLAAMNIGSLERVDNSGEVNYRLSDAQSAKFKNYKAAVE